MDDEAKIAAIFDEANALGYRLFIELVEQPERDAHDRLLTHKASAVSATCGGNAKKLGRGTTRLEVAELAIKHLRRAIERGENP